jgi:SulP family sulfate permease
MTGLPIAAWLPSYQRGWLKADLVAGLTVWALVVPQAIAYGQIAGLPPEAGLSAAFAGMLGYALLGTSRQLVVSPTSSTAAVSAAIVAPLALGDPSRYLTLAAALAILTGVIFILLGRWRAGFISQFIATAVQAGFMFGLGLTIIVGQAAKVFGISGGEGDFFPQLWHLLTHLGETNAWTLAVGLASLAALLLLKRYVPAAPAALIVVAAAIVLVAALGLADRGVTTLGVASGSLPLPALPAIGLNDVVALLPGAVAISVIGVAESIIVAEEFADEHRYEIRPDQELIAAGGANVLAGLFQGFIVAGGASQSAANDRAGARTEIAALVAAALTVITAVALLPLFRDLPDAVLGAIVIVAVLGFLRVNELQRIRRIRRDSFVGAIFALAAVLVLGILPGLLLAVGLSLLLLLGRASRPQGSVLGKLPGESAYVDVERSPEAEVEAGVLVFRLNAALIFFNAKSLRDLVRERVRDVNPPPRLVLVDMEFSPGLDVEGADTLVELRDELGEHDTELWLANVRGPVADLLRRRTEDEASDLRSYRTIDTALRAWRDGEADGRESIGTSAARHEARGRSVGRRRGSRRPGDQRGRGKPRT